MVVLLTILGTIFLIVSAIFWLEPKFRTVDIVIASVATILMTLCYVGSVLAQYIVKIKTLRSLYGYCPVEMNAILGGK